MSATTPPAETKVDGDMLRAARFAYNLTQTQAAAVIGKPLRTWQNWEAPEGSPSHRKMDPALFELFILKAPAVKL